jgi:hypothetical protein
MNERAPITTHWSLPPQHVGYWTRLGGGDGWPERGGMGPQAGPHIPGLIPGWHDFPMERQRTGPGVRPPRGGMSVPGRPPRPPRRGIFNAFRPARRSGPAHWR